MALSVGKGAFAKYARAPRLTPILSDTDFNIVTPCNSALTDSVDVGLISLRPFFEHLEVMWAVDQTQNIPEWINMDQSSNR